MISLRAVTLLFLLMPAVGTLSCGTKSVLVPRGPHQPRLEKPPHVVRTPPPPAKIEVLPLRRNNECLYQDGYHYPEEQSWAWKKGAWVLPPKGCYYAPARTSYEKVRRGTALVYREGVWLPRRKGGSICDDATPCPDPFVAPPKARPPR